MDYYSSLDSRSLDQTPTIFEIISSNELSQLLSPSVRYIIVHYATRYPKVLLKLALNFPEVNLLLRGTLEWHFLKRWNASFTEKFYGLKRTSKNKINVNDKDGVIFDMMEMKRRLNKWQILVSLLKIVGLEYLKEKCDVLYEKLYPQMLLNKFDKNTFKYWMVKIYPYILSTGKVLDVLFQVLYLSGKTKSPSFIDWCANIEYSRLTKFDYDLNEHKPRARKVSKRPPTFYQNTISQLRYYSSPVNIIISNLSTTVFPSAIFLLKFLEWWNTSEFASKLTKKQQNIVDKPIPPPSTLASFKQQNSSLCPICDKEITNHAVIETGYVFCYPCIFNYLDSMESPRCPITGLRLINCKRGKIDGIRKLII